MPASSEAAANSFLELARRLEEHRQAPGEQILAGMLAFYRQVRVDDADLTADGDMLLLQWGRMRPWLLRAPTDLRLVEDGELQLEATERRYLNVTRQLIPTGAGAEAEFDDVAIQLSLTLVYEEADGSERDANRWVHSPTDLDAILTEFRQEAFVAALLARVPERVVATVDWAG
jgi:hypothetical protein